MKNRGRVDCPLTPSVLSSWSTNGGKDSSSLLLIMPVSSVHQQILHGDSVPAAVTRGGDSTTEKARYLPTG